MQRARIGESPLREALAGIEIWLYEGFGGALDEGIYCPILGHKRTISAQFRRNSVVARYYKARVTFPATKCSSDASYGTKYGRRSAL